MKSWRVHIETHFYTDKMKVWVHRFDPHTRTADFVQGPLTMITVGEGQLSPDVPTLELNRMDAEDFLQAFMDAGWEEGIRPQGFEDHTNELKAVRYHLEDMRLLGKVRPAK